MKTNKEVDTEVTEEIKPMVNPRDEAMQASVQAAREARKQAEKDYQEENGTSAESNMLMIAPEVDEPEPEVIVDTEDKEKVDNVEEVADTQFVTRGTERFLKLKVNGEDKELSLDDAIAKLQKNENADMKLYQANQILKQANEKQQPQAPTLPDDSSETVVDSQEVLKDALTKLYDGDIDIATETLSKLLYPKSKPQAPIDIDSAVRASLAKQEDHKNLTGAYKAFESSEDFGFIAKDPVLLDRLDRITSDLQQDSDYMSKNPTYADIFTEAGTRVKSWLGNVTGSVSQSQPNETDKRLSLKEKKGEGILPGSVRRNTTKVEVTPPSRADIIAEIARKRGQTIYE
jgi:hypothetical protein